MKHFIKIAAGLILISSLCTSLWAKTGESTPEVYTRWEYLKTGGILRHYEFAGGEKQQIRSDEEYTFLLVNGNIIPNVSAKSINGHSLIPLRVISGELGMKVQWQKDTQTITIEKNNVKAKINVGKKQAKVNNKDIVLETSPAVIKGSVYVPVKFIAQTFSISFKYEKHGDSIISSVLSTPMITLDEESNDVKVNKEQAIAIAKDVMNEKYCIFKKEGSFKDNALYEERLKSMEKDINEIKVTGKVSRYWKLKGPESILIDENTGKMYVFDAGNSQYMILATDKDSDDASWLLGTWYFGE